MNFRTTKEAQAINLPLLPISLSQNAENFARATASSNASPVSTLKKLYAIADEITDIISPYMVCTKGCSHCCRIDVLVSTIEAQYIEKNLSVPTQKAYSRAVPTTEQPCPFLDSDNSCSIYEHRPFACRTFFTVDDPAYCKDLDTPHATYSSSSNGILRHLYQMIVDLNGKRPIRDIRNFFPSGR